MVAAVTAEVSHKRSSVLQKDHRSQSNGEMVGLAEGAWRRSGDSDGVTVPHVPGHVVRGTVIATLGSPRRPQPVDWSQRFRFCPVATSSASMFTLTSPRSRNRLRPCQALASAKSGSTQTLRFLSAFS